VIVVLFGSLSGYTSSDALAEGVEGAGAAEDGAADEGAAGDGADDDGAADDGVGDVVAVWAQPAKRPSTNTNAISSLGKDFFSITIKFLLIFLSSFVNNNIFISGFSISNFCHPKCV